MSTPIPPAKDLPDPVPDGWKPLREGGKYSATIVVMVVAFYLLREKLSHLDWPMFWQGLKNISVWRIVGAIALVAVNYLILTGYDLIAVRYLKKKLPLRKVMTGAVVGYAMSNVLGWIFGGTAVRYRMYSSWGFSFKEIVAFISILSLTFWLGMFLLAGIAFAVLPVRLPEEISGIPLRRVTLFDPHIWGWIFLIVVASYLAACAWWRRPIRWGQDEFQLPPVSVSSQQLAVSAADFALASATLYILLPAHISNFSTVLVAYLAGMILTVTLHVPGGFGVLDLTLLSMLQTAKGSKEEAAIAAGLVVFRVIYYFLPALVAGVLFIWNEVEMRAIAARAPKIVKPAA
jgi:glycosyltransferase 2 family protein